MSTSVIIATYNGKSKGFLVDAIDSLLRQSERVSEIVVVDNASTDGTAEFVRKKYPKVILLTENNRGVSHARNAGIVHSGAQFVTFLDDDDVWSETKNEVQSKYLREHPDVGLVACEATIIDEENKQLYDWHSPWDTINVDHLLGGNMIYSPSSVMIRRSVLDKVGVFDPRYSYAEDFDLWIRVASVAKVEMIHQPLLRYRMHQEQATAKPNRTLIDRATYQVITSYETTASGGASFAFNEAFFLWGALYRALRMADFTNTTSWLKQLRVSPISLLALASRAAESLLMSSVSLRWKCRTVPLALLGASGRSVSG